MSPEFIRDQDLREPDYYQQKLVDIRPSHEFATKRMKEAEQTDNEESRREWQQERGRLARCFAETQNRLKRSLRRFGA